LGEFGYKSDVGELMLFESVINFLHTLILFFNNIDKHKSQLQKVLLEKYSPKYQAEPDISRLVKNILCSGCLFAPFTFCSPFYADSGPLFLDRLFPFV